MQTITVRHAALVQGDPGVCRAVYIRMKKRPHMLFCTHTSPFTRNTFGCVHTHLLSEHMNTSFAVRVFELEPSFEDRMVSVTPTGRSIPDANPPMHRVPCQTEPQPLRLERSGFGPWSCTS